LQPEYAIDKLSTEIIHITKSPQVKKSWWEKL